MLDEKFLLIAEKPDAAKLMAKPFPHEKKQGYIEVKPNEMMKRGGIISFAFGHLVSLANPEEFDEKYKKWSLDTLPITPDDIPLRPIKGKEKQLKLIKELANRSDIEVIINGCDAGREGENIFISICKYNKINKPMLRLWTSSLAPSSIKSAFKTLKKGEDTMPLYYSAYSRSIADYYVGLSATRAVSLLMKASIESQNSNNVPNLGVWSVGRCQTPLVKLIYDREKEIENFKPEPFWTILADFEILGKRYSGKWINIESNAERFMKKELAEVVVNKIKGHDALVEKVINESETTKPPQLYNLSDLQVKANKLYKLSPKEVLDAAQRLYDNSHISYPRTDSNYITEAEAQGFPEIFNLLSQTDAYTSYFPTPILPGNLTRRFINKRKVSDHHAILPTDILPDLDKLTDKEKKIYDLIVRSVIAAHYEDAIINHSSIITDVNNEKFISKGKVIEKEGWRKVIHIEKEQKKKKEKEDKDIELPKLVENSSGKLVKTNIKEGKTQAKKRYTQGDLISIMKNCGRNIEDKELSKILHATEGIGTEATRSSLIENILDKSYIFIKSNSVYPTPKAMMLIEALGTESAIASPIMTAKWEQALKAIAEGKYSHLDFLQKSKVLTKNLVSNIIDRSKDWNFENEVAQLKELAKIGECPNCGSDIVEYEKFYGCKGYKEHNCKFGVKKTIAKKKISEAQIKKLLKNKKTDVINGFVSNSGSKFNTYLFWNVQKQCVDWGFNAENQESSKKKSGKDTGINCPFCGKEMVEYEKFIGCKGFKDGCEFKIPKKYCGVDLTSQHFEQLVNQGETTQIDGFIYNGKNFSKCLCVKDGKVVFKK
ncbi:TPA: DNA topoisomerase 3 [Bacillus cytotoxicus]|nr:DNA topoisomerase 3 [Bacillus cytotoxicus]